MSPDEREGCGAPHSEAAEELVLAAPATPATAAAAPTDGSPRWIEPRRLTAEPLAGDVSALSVSSDGRWVAAGTDDGELLLMRAPAVASSGVADAIVWRAAAHLAAVTCVRFADGAALPAARSWRRAARTARAPRGGRVCPRRRRRRRRRRGGGRSSRRRQRSRRTSRRAVRVRRPRAAMRSSRAGGSSTVSTPTSCTSCDRPARRGGPPARRPQRRRRLAAERLARRAGGGGGGEWVPIVAAVAVEPSNSGRLAAAVGRSVYLLLDDGPLAQLHASATVCALGYARRRRLLCASGYGGVRVWSDFGLGPAVARLLPFKGPLEAMDVAADERYVACGAQDATLVVGRSIAPTAAAAAAAAAVAMTVAVVVARRRSWAAASDGPSGEGAAAACGGAALFFGGATSASRARRVGPVRSAARQRRRSERRRVGPWRRGAPPPVRRNGRSALLIGDATVTGSIRPGHRRRRRRRRRRPPPAHARGGGRRPRPALEVRPPPPPPADRDAADGGGGDPRRGGCPARTRRWPSARWAGGGAA